MKYLKLKFLLMFFALAMAIPPAWAGITYKKVTNDNPITDGSKCILVYEAGSYAMGALDSNGRGNAIGVEVDNDEVDITNAEGVTEFTFVGTSNSFFLMISEDTYLAYSAKGKFSTVSTSNPSISGKECWKTGSQDNGKYVINNWDTGFGIRFNTNQSLNKFAPYASSSGGCYAALLYVKTEGGDTPTLSSSTSTLTLKEPNGSFTVTGANLVDNVGVTQNPEGLFNLTFSGDKPWGFERDGENKVNGTVTVSYQGRDLTATGTIIPGTKNAEWTADIEAPVTVTYQPDIYIYCDLVDGNSWRYYPDEPQMTYADGKYTKTVTITNPGSCIMFAKAAGLTYNWNDDRQFFGAKWDSDWVYGVDNSKYIANYGSGSSQGKNQYYPIKFNQTGVYTITIDPEAMEFTVTKTSVDNIAAAQDFEGDTFTFMGEAVVTYQNGQNLWIRDNSGSGLIYGTLDGTFENGDILAAGWTAENDMYLNTIPEFINPTSVTSSSNSGEVAPLPLTKIEVADINKYASISNVTITRVNNENNYFTVDGVEYNLRDEFGQFDPLEVDHVYNVVGVVSYYSGKPQLWLTEVEDVTPMSVTLDPSTKTVTAGQTIPVTVTVENAVGDYTISYKIGENGTPTDLTDGNVIDVTSETAGDVTLYVTVTNGDNQATAQGTYTFTEPAQPGSNVFTKVTSATLEPGKKYIFVSEANQSSYSMGAETHNNSNNYYVLPVEVSVIDANHVEINENVDVFTLDEITDQYTQAKSYIFIKDGTYLSPTSSGSTDLKFEESSDKAGWQAKADDNGIFVLSDIGNPDSEKARTILYRELSSGNRFAHYQKTNATNSGYYWAYLYVQTAEDPVPELTVTLPEAPEEHYKVGQVVKVKATVENGSENTVLTYKVGDETLTIGEDGNVTLPNKKSGEVELTVTAVDGDKEATDTKTYVFDPAEALTITLDPATGTYYVGDEQNVTVTVKGAIATNPTITYKFGEEGETQTYNAETGIELPTTQAGIISLTVMVDDGGYEHTGATTATGTYTINHKALTITLTPENAEFNVGAQDTKVKVDIDNVVGELVEDYKATYTYNGKEKTLTLTRENGYITLPNDKAVTYNVTATVMDERMDDVTATGTYTFTALPAITFDLSTDQVNYTVGDVVKVKATDITGTFGEYDVTYMIGETTLKPDEEGYVTIPSDEAGEVVLTVTVEDLYEHESAATQEITFHFAAGGPISITLTADPEAEAYTVGDVVNVKVTTNGTIGNDNDVLITYTTDFESKAESTYDPKKGIDITSDKAGDVTLTVNVYDGYAHEGADENGITTKTAKYTFVKAPAINITFDPASGTEFTVGQEAKVKVTIAGAADDYEAEYKIGDNVVEPVDGYIVLPNTATDDVTLTVSVYDGIDRIGADENGFTTATATYTFSPMPVVAAPTFSLVAGTYGKAQQLTITAENGANILYSTDGSEPTTEYSGAAIDLGQGTTTVKAVATKEGFANSPVVSATYIIDIPEELPTITPFKGYYQIKNNGNGMYANIAGRKTLNFTDAENAKKMAGTVIWLETNKKGQVQSLRSQAADLQGYANRAMRYVPQMVDIVVNKINQMEGIEDATGAGSVLGKTGLDSIMAKFNECFDYHLYVEEAQGGWRLYGKTPNMQHVVDFYRDHKDQVEAKLPKLEKFINDALHKLINKIGGSTVFTDFSLHQIWENMGGNLPEPVVGDDAAIMDFYRAVLNNKNYVWDFAYQTAQIYWNNVKDHPRYDELKEQLGEYADYIDEFVTQVRPDFKYYVIQRGDEPDYISEGNGEIINNDPRTLWTLEPRTDFTVNIAGEQFGCPYAGGVGGYATTNYTDFAYTVPEGVTAYKVASVENGVANLQALSGVIPAQTPVLLMAKTAGDYVLKLSTEAGTKVTGNLLVGVDSLITRFQLKTPMVESLFSLAKGVLGEQLYNQYVAQYEYLQLLYAGTVNNKYFWGLTRDDVMKCLNANGDDCVVRDLSGSKFIDNRQVKTNKAFLVSETDQTITISTLRGDVNHDGYVNIDDVTALIDYLLEVDGRACPYCANVNCDSTVNIVDVTYLIDILLGNISPYAEGGNGN